VSRLRWLALRRAKPIVLLMAARGRGANARAGSCLHSRAVFRRRAHGDGLRSFGSSGLAESVVVLCPVNPGVEM